jgi:hypothetical protein
LLFILSDLKGIGMKPVDFLVVGCGNYQTQAGRSSRAEAEDKERRLEGGKLPDLLHDG